jgi:hypothetical protein
MVSAQGSNASLLSAQAEANSQSAGGQETCIQHAEQHQAVEQSEQQQPQQEDECMQDAGDHMDSAGLVSYNNSSDDAESSSSSSSSSVDAAAHLTPAQEHAAVILTLRLAGVDPNAAAGEVRETPLTLAAWNCACVAAAALLYGGAQLASTSDEDEQLQQQQQQGADPDLPRQDGSRPIDLAAGKGNPAFMMLLLQQGAAALLGWEHAATAPGATSSSSSSKALTAVNNNSSSSSSSRALTFAGSSSDAAQAHQAHQQLMVEVVAASTKHQAEDVARVVRELLAQGFPADVVGKNGGGSALCGAAIMGYTEVRFCCPGLLGFRVGDCGDRGVWWPLCCAAIMGYLRQRCVPGAPSELILRFWGSVVVVVGRGERGHPVRRSHHGLCGGTLFVVSASLTAAVLSCQKLAMTRGAGRGRGTRGAGAAGSRLPC